MLNEWLALGRGEERFEINTRLKGICGMKLIFFFLRWIVDGWLDLLATYCRNKGVGTDKCWQVLRTEAKKAVIHIRKNAPAHRSLVRYVAKNIHFCVINHSRALKIFKKISVSPVGTKNDYHHFDRLPLMLFWQYIVHDMSYFVL